MATAVKPGWSRPAAILFASEFPVDEKAFSIALSEASEFNADLIVFHAYDNPHSTPHRDAGSKAPDYSVSRTERDRFEPIAQRAKNLGIHCKVVVRPGRAAEQILAFLHEHKIDRVVMGAHSPGPIGKLLVGSVAEAVLRNANVPVNIVGPHVIESAHRNSSDRTILCSTCTQTSRCVVAGFAADLAAKHHAGLILQQVIPDQERAEVMAGRSVDQMEAELLALIPAGLKGKLHVRTRVVFGDPVEDLLYQGRSQRASLPPPRVPPSSTKCWPTHNAR
jgi:nucleotide-binding universal stress UspA family protein